MSKMQFQRKSIFVIKTLIKQDCSQYSSMFMCKYIPLTTMRKILILLVFWSVPIFIYYKNEETIFLKREITFRLEGKMDIQEIPAKIETELRNEFTKTEHQNVIFLKTHKTGSSTVTNIMQRFAKSRGLNVALPKCEHRFCYPNKFEETSLFEHKENDTYNMLFNHAVFHKKKMLKIMAPQNLKLVTIIREPFSQFDSAAQYLNFRKFYNLSENAPLLDEFFKIPEESLKRFLQSADLSEGEGAFALAKNPNAFDLGFNVWNETPEYIEDVLRTIKQDFHLVMIMEYMEESLVLLKKELNWDLEDIVFYVHNARKFKEKNTNDAMSIRKKVLNWNKLDTAIYNHFNETLWVKIKNSPPEFEEDVKTLKEWNQHLVNYCTFFKVTHISSSLLKKYKEKTGANLCADLLKEDIPFTSWFKIMRHFKSKRWLPIKW